MAWCAILGSGIRSRSHLVSAAGSQGSWSEAPPVLASWKLEAHNQLTVNWSRGWTWGLDHPQSCPWPQETISWWSKLQLGSTCSFYTYQHMGTPELTAASAILGSPQSQGASMLGPLNTVCVQLGCTCIFLASPLDRDIRIRKRPLDPQVPGMLENHMCSPAANIC